MGARRRTQYFTFASCHSGNNPSTLIGPLPNSTEYIGRKAMPFIRANTRCGALTLFFRAVSLPTFPPSVAAHAHRHGGDHRSGGDHPSGTGSRACPSCGDRGRCARCRTVCTGVHGSKGSAGDLYRSQASRDRAYPTSRTWSTIPTRHLRWSPDGRAGSRCLMTIAGLWGDGPSHGLRQTCSPNVLARVRDQGPRGIIHSDALALIERACRIVPAC